jgi:predicted Rossmann fold nucleotide-binding protein DprA/Smf involved in DNA uptake
MFNEDLPIKRVVIAGCRDYDNYNEAKAYIDICLSNIRKRNEIIIISGGAKGADSLGERYAEENGFKVEKYPADWERYGRSAGPRRNRQMAEISDYVICFWDGESRGTRSMIESARKFGKPVKIKRI